MQFGGVDVTAIASVEKGKKEKLSIDGGAQTSKISIKIMIIVKILILSRFTLS
jgi:hypothetical protein